jgi:hypothetical protein
VTLAPGLAALGLAALGLVAGAGATLGCQPEVSPRTGDGGGDAARAEDVGLALDAPSPLDAPVEDAPVALDAVAPVDLCTAPSGSLIDGTFEGGLDGMVPRGGWQLRDPGFAAGCGGDHLSMVAAPPGCPGQALLVDARGSWDCYAIQAFTDYNTIEGGRTYRISAVVRSEAQDNPAAWFVVGLQWLDGSDRVFGDEKNPRPADVNYEWTRLEWDLVAPADARRAVIWLSAHFPGRVTYDQVSIRPR